MFAVLYAGQIWPVRLNPDSRITDVKSIIPLICTKYININLRKTFISGGFLCERITKPSATAFLNNKTKLCDLQHLKLPEMWEKRRGQWGYLNICPLSILLYSHIRFHNNTEYQYSCHHITLRKHQRSPSKTNTAMIMSSKTKVTQWNTCSLVSYGHHWKRQVLW